MTKNLQKTLHALRSAFSDQTGGPLVETALTAPILLVMILGVVEFGRVGLHRGRNLECGQGGCVLRFTEPDHRN